MTKKRSFSKLTLRTCIGCRMVNKKENMLRLVADHDNQVLLDEHQTLGGRGAYICSIECLKKVLENNQINKALRQRVKTDQLEKLPARETRSVHLSSAF